MYTTLTRLRIARLDRGLTQFIVGKRAGISPARVSLLERSHDDPSDTEKTALARVLGTTPEQLFPPVITITSTDSPANPNALH